MASWMGSDYNWQAGLGKNFAINTITGGIGNKLKWGGRAGAWALRQGIEIAGDTAIDVSVYGNDLGQSLAWNMVGSIGGEALASGIGRGLRNLHNNFEFHLNFGALTTFNSGVPINIISFSRRASRNAADVFEEGLRVRRGVDIGIRRPDRHHIFPQELRDFFSSRGLNNIDDYTIPLDKATHEAIHKWMGSGKWNEVIKSRILAEEARRGGELLSRRESLQIGAQMRREAGLSHIKIIPYLD